MSNLVIGILTGGGDVPGLNTCMKSVVLGALESGYSIKGIRRGWGGLMEFNPDDADLHQKLVRDLGREDVRTVDRTGGTFLHSSRTNPQKVKAKNVPDFLVNSRFGKKIDEDGTMDFTDHILRVLDILGIDVLISIGGDDTLSFSARLDKEDFRIVGIPKTMDNDVFGTDYCIGFSTSISRSVDVITNMRTSIGSHERIGIIELFGRYSGETSLITGYLAYCDRCIISEVPFEIERLAYFLKKDKMENPSNYSLMTISEGASIIGGDMIVSGEADAYGHKKLGGIGVITAEEIKRLTGEDIMYQQLGYIVRSGPPDSLDRMVANSFGNLALQLIQRGETGKMVALNGGKYTTVPIGMVMAGKKRVDVAGFYDVENYRPKVQNFMGVPMFFG